MLALRKPFYLEDRLLSGKYDLKSDSAIWRALEHVCVQGKLLNVAHGGSFSGKFMDILYETGRGLLRIIELLL